eukprot:Clim_evm14s38 gene=Clim_evmTU14s38
MPSTELPHDVSSQSPLDPDSIHSYIKPGQKKPNSRKRFLFAAAAIAILVIISLTVTLAVVSSKSDGSSDSTDDSTDNESPESSTSTISAVAVDYLNKKGDALTPSKLAEKVVKEIKKSGSGTVPNESDVEQQLQELASNGSEGLVLLGQCITVTSQNNSSGDSTSGGPSEPPSDVIAQVAVDYLNGKGDALSPSKLAEKVAKAIKTSGSGPVCQSDVEDTLQELAQNDSGGLALLGQCITVASQNNGTDESTSDGPHELSSNLIATAAVDILNQEGKALKPSKLAEKVVKEMKESDSGPVCQADVEETLLKLAQTGSEGLALKNQCITVA